MAYERLPFKETIDGLPPEWPDDPLPAIREALRTSSRKVVIIDDDPTGAQTVYDVPVLTEWSVDTLEQEFTNDLTNFYVLANTRAMAIGDAQSQSAAITRSVVRAADNVHKDFVLVSRSDSTLRGHFPGEVEAIEAELGVPFDGWVFVPFFLEGGRYTLDDVHYVAEGEWLTPAGKTEFARDSAFAFRSSNLRDYIEEKTSGRIKASEVVSISLDDVRKGGPDAVASKMMSESGGRVCIVNAASMRDLEVLNLGLLQAEAKGKRFIYRTAASFIRARLGQTARDLLTRDEMGADGDTGGLVIVGSYVDRTTSQLNHMLQNTNVVSIEANVQSLLANSGADEIARVASAADDHLKRGDDVVVYTSREPVTGSNAEENLSIIRRVSDGMVSIMDAITVKPRFLVAKGGNTSSELATKGLNVKRCTVPGQILPGVPVWQLGPESHFPGLMYVVFPGNVGGEDALSLVIEKMRAS